MQTVKFLRAFSISLLTFFLTVLLSTFFLAKELQQTSNPPSKDRAVSLKVLEERVKNCMAKGECPQNILELYGLRRIYGYVLDDRNKDIILIGKIDTNYPPLYLEDFVIALRNAWWKYAPLEGNTYYYSSPGCSIDPDSQTLQKLQELGDRILSTPEELESALQSWRNICDEPESVKVEGIPFNTYFAKVMVEADYYMKRIVDGSVSLEIEGFESLMDMALNKAKQDIIQKRPISIPLLNRFWFFPGENRYQEEKGMVIIKKCEVILLTEEQFVTQTGSIAGSGKADPLAQKFAESFSAKYKQISEKKPIYTELEGLFRFVTLAKLMHEKEVLSEAGLDLDYLLNRYPISETHVDRTLPGLSNVKKLEHRRDFPGGYETVELTIPSCGGVSIDITINNKNLIEDKTGQLLKLRETVLKSRASPNDLYWDFPAMRL
jgi:hypothetical protein